MTQIRKNEKPKSKPIFHSLFFIPFHFRAECILLNDNENGQSVTIYLSQCIFRGLEDVRIYFLLSITNPRAVLPHFISIELEQTQHIQNFTKTHFQNPTIRYSQAQGYVSQLNYIIESKTLCTRIHEYPLLSIHI